MSPTINCATCGASGDTRLVRCAQEGDDVGVMKVRSDDANLRPTPVKA
jgi:hypothetical protein